VAGSAHRLAAVVTPPDGADIISEVVAEKDIAHLELVDPNAPGNVAKLLAFEPELFIIAGHPTIFRSSLLAVPRFGTLNLHAGRLPQYRGGSPLNWQLMNGEDEAGISVIRADKGIDTGPVLVERMFPIGRDDTIADLHTRANSLFPNMVLEALNLVETGHNGRQQAELASQYWHQRSDADGQIDFCRMTAIEVDRMVRALTRPYPGAWSKSEGQRVRIFEARLPELVLRGSPGRICYMQGNGPYVVCSDRAILVTDYLVEGDKQMRLRHGTYLS
jgi:methionyl-tRNA formyltransferase